MPNLFLGHNSKLLINFKQNLTN